MQHKDAELYIHEHGTLSSDKEAAQKAVAQGFSFAIIDDVLDPSVGIGIE